MKKNPRTNPEQVRYPYLLRGLAIRRVNQVWATDITYIPMKTGWAYLVAIIDWVLASRAVVAPIEHARHAVLHRGARGGRTQATP